MSNIPLPGQAIARLGSARSAVPDSSPHPGVVVELNSLLKNKICHEISIHPCNRRNRALHLQQRQYCRRKGPIPGALFSHSGNTRALAERIHEQVGGDLAELKTANPLPAGV